MNIAGDDISTIVSLVGSFLVFVLGLFVILFTSSEAKDVPAVRPKVGKWEILTIASICLLCIFHLTWMGAFAASKAPTLVIASEVVGVLAWATILGLTAARFRKERPSTWLRTVLWPAPVLYASMLVAAFVSVPHTGAMSLAFLVTRAVQAAFTVTCLAAFELSRKEIHAEGESASEPLLGGQRTDVEAQRGGDGEDVPKPNYRKLMLEVLQYVKPQTAWLKLSVVAYLLLICMGRALNLAVPILYGKMIDVIATAGTHAPVPVGQVLLPWVAAYLVVNAIPKLDLLGKARTFLWIPVTQSGSKRINLDVLSHMLDMDLTFHLMRKTGEVMRIMDRGSWAMRSILQTLLTQIVPQGFDVIISVTYLATKMHFWVAVILLSTIVLYVPLTIYGAKRRNEIQRSMNRRDNNMYARRNDALVNFETVKYFNNEGLERSKYNDLIDTYQDYSYKMQTSLIWLDILQEAIVYSGTVIGILVCAKGVADGRLTVGDVVLFISLIGTLMGPLYSFDSVYEGLSRNFVDMEAMFALLDKDPAVKDKEGARQLLVTKGDVDFRNVTFSYNDGTPVLRDVSFHCPGGKTLALVGPTGSGKSTCLRLLFRFYDPNEGSICIDGQDLKEVSQHSLRTHLAVVPQDTVLFNESIRDNIRYGRPGASDSEVEEGATAAAIHDHITSTRFPKGYDTVVGERGLRLSGGEKQRVAVARAVLKDPRILLLDEATSALDSLTEERIKEAVNGMRKSRTTIIVAHRLSTVMDADIIVVLKDGQVLEVGSHAELVAKEGLFTDMWARQSEVNASSASLSSLAPDA